MVDLKLEKSVTKIPAKNMGNSKNKFYFEIPVEWNDLFKNKEAEVSLAKTEDKYLIVYEVSKQ